MHIYPKIFKYSILGISILGLSIEDWPELRNFSFYLKHLEIPKQTYWKIIGERRSELVHSKILYRLKEEERCRINWDFFRYNKIQRQEKEAKKNLPNGMHKTRWQREVQTSVITIIRTDYINGRDNQIGLKNPSICSINLLLSREILKVTRLRTVKNKWMERHLMYQANTRSLLALHIATMDMNKVTYTLQYCLY